MDSWRIGLGFIRKGVTSPFSLPQLDLTMVKTHFQGFC